MSETEAAEHVVIVRLPEEAPVEEEAIVAKPLKPLDGRARCRLLAAPFVSYDVACGDVVAVEPDDAGRLVLTEVLEPSGHLTVRLLLSEDLDLMGRMKALLPLKNLGARAEDPRGRYYALDIPPDADLEALGEALGALEEAGSIEFEVVEPD